MKSNRLKTILVLLGAALVGGLIGTLFKLALPKPTATRATSGEQSRSAEEGSTEPSAKLDDALVTDSKRLAGLPATQRFLWIATQAENAAPADFLGLYQLCRKDKQLQRAVAARWAERDPSGMFEKLLLTGKDTDHYISRILFRQWSKSAPREALAAVLAAKDRRGWTWSLSDELMMHAPEVGIEGYRQMGVKNYLPDTKNVAKWAAKDPAQAARHVVEHMGEDSAGKNVIEKVGTAWAAQDPDAALAYAFTVEGVLGRKLAESALAAWADSDPDAALAFASAIEDPYQKANVGKGLVAGLGKNDPAKAIRWAEENLQSQARASAVQKLVGRIAKEDPSKAAEIVAELEPGSVLNKAAKELVSVWTGDGLDQKDDVLKWIDSLPDKAAQSAAMWDLGWRMEQEEKGGLIKFVESDFGHLATPMLIRSAATTRVGQDPESAIEWAKGLPKDRSEKVLLAVQSQVKRLKSEASK